MPHLTETALLIKDAIHPNSTLEGYFNFSCFTTQLARLVRWWLNCCLGDVGRKRRTRTLSPYATEEGRHLFAAIRECRPYLALERGDAYTPSGALAMLIDWKTSLSWHCSLPSVGCRGTFRHVWQSDGQLTLGIAQQKEGQEWVPTTTEMVALDAHLVASLMRTERTSARTSSRSASLFAKFFFQLTPFTFCPFLFRQNAPASSRLSTPVFSSSAEEAPSDSGIRNAALVGPAS